MSTSLQHSLVEGDEGPALHVYLPAGFAKSDVDLSFSSASGGVSVHFEDLRDGSSLGTVTLEGYSLPATVEAKYKKADRRYTIKLVKITRQPAMAADDETLDEDVVDETFHDAQSDVEIDAGVDAVAPAAAAPAATGVEAEGGAEERDDADGEGEGEGEGIDPEVLKARRRERKKEKDRAKKALKRAEQEAAAAAAAAAPAPAPQAAGDKEGEGATQEQEEAEIGGDEDDTAAGPTDAGASGAAKKKKKKKKKAAGAGAEGKQAAEEEEQQQSPPEASEPEPEQASVPSTAAETESSSVAAAAEQPLPLADAPSVPSPGTPARAGSGARTIHVDLERDFADEPLAQSQVNLAAAPAATLPDPPSLSGPYIKVAYAKNDHKGEDKLLMSQHNTWTLPGIEGSAQFSAFGVLDGHGGKAAPTFASKTLLPTLASYLDRCKGEEPAVPAPPASTAVEVSEQQCKTWATQDALVERLPKAMFAAFVDTDAACQKRCKSSGTTATMAVCSGWQLLVANVGDSLAFLDTGAEIIQVSGNHRVGESTEELDRIKAAGGSIAQSDVDGVIAGPMRVWPGGLMMSRSLGDLPSGGLVLGEPEVRQVTLPPGGARLILASDGLWDAVQYKTFVSNIRKMPAGQAANMAVHSAIKKKGLTDDITVIIVDFCNGPSERLPASLEAVNQGRKRECQEHTPVLRPLDTPSTTWRDVGAARRAEVLAALEAEQAEAQRRVAAAQAALAAAGGGGGCGYSGNGSLSETYRELAELRVDVGSLKDVGTTSTDKKADEGEWHMVGGQSKSPEPKLDYMKELQAAAQVVEEVVTALPGKEGGARGRRDRAPGAGGHRERRERERERAAPAEAGAVQPEGQGQGQGQGQGRRQGQRERYSSRNQHESGQREGGAGEAGGAQNEGAEGEAEGGRFAGRGGRGGRRGGAGGMGRPRRERGPGQEAAGGQAQQEGQPPAGGEGQEQQAGGQQQERPQREPRPRRPRAPPAAQAATADAGGAAGVPDSNGGEYQPQPLQQRPPRQPRQPRQPRADRPLRNAAPPPAEGAHAQQQEGPMTDAPAAAPESKPAAPRILTVPRSALGKGYAGHGASGAGAAAATPGGGSESATYVANGNHAADPGADGGGGGGAERYAGGGRRGQGPRGPRPGRYGGQGQHAGRPHVQVGGHGEAGAAAVPAGEPALLSPSSAFEFGAGFGGGNFGPTTAASSALPASAYGVQGEQGSGRGHGPGGGRRGRGYMGGRGGGRGGGRAGGGVPPVAEAAAA